MWKRFRKSLAAKQTIFCSVSLNLENIPVSEAPIGKEIFWEREYNLKIVTTCLCS